MPVCSIKLPQRRTLRLWAAAGILLLVLGGFRLWHGASRISDDDARVEGKLQLLTAGVAGRVAAVCVTDNQTVQSGEELIRLEDGPLKVALAEARARLEAVRRGVPAAFVAPSSNPSAVGSAEQAMLAAVEAARNDELAVRRDFEHLTTLHAQALLEVRRLDALPGGRRPGVEQHNKARLAEIEARGNMEEAGNRLAEMSRARAAREGELRRFRTEMNRLDRTVPDVLRESQIELETARVREAEQNVASAVLRAAVDGRVERLEALPGMEVSKGRLLGVVVPTRSEDLWCMMRVPESRAAEVEPGMTCEIVVPALRGQSFKGVVSGVSEQKDAPEATAANRAEKSGVLVRVALLKQGDVPELQIGMRAEVTVLTRAPRIAVPSVVN